MNTYIASKEEAERFFNKPWGYLETIKLSETKFMCTKRSCIFRDCLVSWVEYRVGEVT